MKNIVLSLFFLMIALQVEAQFEQAARLDIVHASDVNEDFDVFPMGEDGLLFIRQIEGYNPQNGEWIFKKYDKDLKEKWSTVFKVDFYLDYRKNFYNKQFGFWLFSDSDNEEIAIIRIDLQNGETDTFKGKLLKALDDIQDFGVLGNTAFLTGTYDDRSVIERFRFFDASSAFLNGLFDKQIQISNVALDEQKQELQVTIREKQKGKCNLAVKIYDYTGELVQILKTKDETGKSLTTGRLLKSDQNLWLVGNYANFCSNTSEGLYLSSLEANETTQPTFVSFAEMENFFNYLRPKRVQKIKEKIERKKQEGRESHFFHSLLVNRVIPSEGETLVLAEIYSPFQRTGDGTYSSVRFDPPNRLVEGYRFSHVIMCGFSQDGKMLWDNCVKTNYIDSGDLEPQTHLIEQNGRKVLVYLDKEKLVSQQFKKAQLVGDQQEFGLKVNDNIRDISPSKLRHWYGDYMLVWGRQRVDTSDSKTFKQEDIFQISKFKYDFDYKPTAK